MPPVLHGGGGLPPVQPQNLFDLQQAQLFGAWVIFGGGYVTPNSSSLWLVARLKGEVRNEL